MRRQFESNPLVLRLLFLGAECDVYSAHCFRNFALSPPNKMVDCHAVCLIRTPGRNGPQGLRVNPGPQGQGLRGPHRLTGDSNLQ